MRRLFLILLATSAWAAGPTITWTKIPIPGGCSDSAVTPCYWPIGQGFATIVPDPVHKAVLFYTTRQASTGHVSVAAGGLNVTWLDGDHFGNTWALAVGDTITINGVSKTIVQGSVTSTTLTLTTAAGVGGPFTFSAAGGTLTMSTDIYDYFPANATAATKFGPPFPGGNGTITNASGNLETDNPAGTWPADRQQTTGEFYDPNRKALWFTAGVNGGKSWNCSTSGGLNCNAAQFFQTTWRMNLSTGVWTGLSSSASTHPVNTSIAQTSNYDPDDNIIVQVGSDGGPGFRTQLGCFTDLNPTPGTLTAQQTTDGCTLADAWNTVTTNGAAMPNLTYPGFVWSGSIHKFVLFGGGTGVGNATIYTYAPRTKTWAIVGATGCGTIPAPVGGTTFTVGLDYIPYLQAFIYHYFAASPQDWMYDPALDTCTQLTAVGTGPVPADGGAGAAPAIAYESSSGKLVSMQQTSLSLVWEGQLSVPSLSVPLTIQEATYNGDQTGRTSVAGTGGIDRTNEPFCQGVPIPDALAIPGGSVSTLNLHGATAGQFRVLGVWPDGFAKWIEVCGIVPFLPAGGTTTVTLTNDGTGNFGNGGSNLAALAGSTITVTTGAVTETIKAGANYNVIDTAVVGATTVLATSASPTRGLILLGPDPTGVYPANVTCSAGSCAVGTGTLFSSANDPNSTCIIEENGPVKSVLRCRGTHYDTGAVHPYMHYTARMTNYLNKPYTTIEVALRNADWDIAHTPSQDCTNISGVCSGQTFNSAYKGFQSYELRLSPNISAPITYTIASETTANTGTVTSSAYIYQGQVSFMYGAEPQGSTCPYNSTCTHTFTTDNGYVISNNGANIQTGDQTKIVPGYADCSNASGVGIEIGVYQFGPYFPKSLECDGNGTDVRIGMYPQFNAVQNYMPWPTWHIDNLFIEFHTTAPASMKNDFLKFQHYLTARPSSLAYTNSTGVFPYALVDPAVENTYFYNVATTATPAVLTKKMCYLGSTAATCVVRPDRSINYTAPGQSPDTSDELNLGIYREVNVTDAGPYNQEEFRWSDILNFYRQPTGYTGDYLNSAHYYKFIAEKMIPHLDGGVTAGTDATVNSTTWQTRPHFNATVSEVDSTGQPIIGHLNNTSTDLAPTYSTNNTRQWVDWLWGADQLHPHYFGMMDYYFMTGNETIRESLTAAKAIYLNPDTSQQNNAIGGGYKIARAIGLYMMGAAKLSQFYAATGDADAAAVLASGVLMYTNNLKPDPCVNSLPTGCTMPSLGTDSNSDPRGISHVRGHPAGSRGQGFCPAASGNNFYRIDQAFETSIEEEGLWILRGVKGPTWSDWEIAIDEGYLMALGQLGEAFYDDGTAFWRNPGVSDARFNGFRYELPLDLAAKCSSTIPLGQGTATVSGTAVTIVSGALADSTWCSSGLGGGCTGSNSRQFSINGYQSSVTHVTDANHITINAAVTGNYASPTLFQIDGPGTASVASDGITVTDQSGQPFTSAYIGQRFGFASTGAGTVASVGSGTTLTLSGVGVSGAVATSNYQVGSVANGDFLLLFADGSIRDSQTLASGGQGLWFNFYLPLQENNTTEWERKFKIALTQTAINGGSHWSPDFGSYQTGALIAALNNPPTTSLQDIAFTCTNCPTAGTSATVQFTAPTGTSFLRIKSSPGAIANSGGPSSIALSGGDGLLGYVGDTQTFTLTPTGSCSGSLPCATWAGATAMTEPAPTGVLQTVSVPVSVGAVAANISVKAMAPQVGVCSITTGTPLPPGSVGVPYSSTITTSGCASPTFSLSSGSLPTGLGPINPSTGTISGTPSGPSGVSGFTVSVTDANGNPSQAYTLNITGAGSTGGSTITGTLTGKVAIQ